MKLFGFNILILTHVWLVYRDRLDFAAAFTVCNSVNVFIDFFEFAVCEVVCVHRCAEMAAEFCHTFDDASMSFEEAAQAIARLVDSFAATEKDPVRNQLADSLRAVLSQKLDLITELKNL